jgi:hypothetical protein
MSGTRNANFREGDRSELLAQYYLSKLGLCSPIPRQEDIGLDFSCSIADQETGALSFGFPYLVSVKSRSSPNIVLAPSNTTIGNNGTEHVAWLFRQNLPIMLAVVDKETDAVSLFSTIPIWFLYHRDLSSIGTLTLAPRFDASRTHDVGRPSRSEELSTWRGHYDFVVDLGFPVAILTDVSRQSQADIQRMKESLRQAVWVAELNTLHARLRIPHFYWFNHTTPDASRFTTAFWYEPIPPSVEARLHTMSALAPSLISMAMHYSQVEDTEALRACVTLLGHAPPGAIPAEVTQHVPELLQSAAGPAVPPPPLAPAELPPP